MRSLLVAALILLPSRTFAAPAVVRITARRYSYSPDHLTLKKGVPVVLELVSLDRKHGFEIADLKVRSTIPPDAVTRVTIVP
jgi:cytochrome c oxidase subunit 2